MKWRNNINKNERLHIVDGNARAAAACWWSQVRANARQRHDIVLSKAEPEHVVNVNTRAANANWWKQSRAKSRLRRNIHLNWDRPLHVGDVNARAAAASCLRKIAISDVNVGPVTY
jgi:hypothetical protein